MAVPAISGSSVKNTELPFEDWLQPAEFRWRMTEAADS
jgi:hypothetical protein